MIQSAIAAALGSALASTAGSALASTDGSAGLVPLASGASQYSLPFVGPGTYLIFGIVLAPVYAMVAAWFVGSPSDRSKGMLGVGYLVGLTAVLWGGLGVATVIIGGLFF